MKYRYMEDMEESEGRSKMHMAGARNSRGVPIRESDFGRVGRLFCGGKEG